MSRARAAAEAAAATAASLETMNNNMAALTGLVTGMNGKIGELQARLDNDIPAPATNQNPAGHLRWCRRTTSTCRPV